MTAQRRPIPCLRRGNTGNTLSTLISGLVEHGFVVTHISDEFEFDTEAEPGSWNHLVSVAPPWLEFWSIYRPDVK